MTGPVDPDGREYSYESPELYTEHDAADDEPVEGLAEAERRMAALEEEIDRLLGP